MHQKALSDSEAPLVLRGRWVDERGVYHDLGQ
jgi:hypothetical protein